MEKVYGNQREAILVGYLAGIIDGEGSFSLAKSHAKTRKYEGNSAQTYKSPQYGPKVTIGMQERAILELFEERYGGSIREECVPNRKSVFRYTLGKKDSVLVLIDELLPYLIEKQERGRVLKEFIETSDYTRYYGENRRILKTSEKELARREDFFQRMKKLNSRQAPATTNRDDTGDGEVIV